jgi:hypothetical protein
VTSQKKACFIVTAVIISNLISVNLIDSINMALSIFCTNINIYPRIQKCKTKFFRAFEMNDVSAYLTLLTVSGSARVPKRNFETICVPQVFSLFLILSCDRVF